jgi:hypothetical protein
MAMQQKSLAVAKGMTGGESGPGWQRALYASPERAQYKDPWEQLDASVTDEKARAEARRSAMRSDYERKKAAWLEAHAPKPEPVALPKVESAASVAFGNRTPDPATPTRSRPVPAMTPRRSSDGTY